MKKTLELYTNIVKEISLNSLVTEKYLANKYGYSERTIRRCIRNLKYHNVIKLKGIGKKREWIIINKL